LTRRCSISRTASLAAPNTTDAANPQQDRGDAARKFAIEAARLVAHSRCHNVALLDVTGISPVTDYFILATGTSARQMRSVCDELAEFGPTHNYSPLAQSGTEGESWMLIDFVDIVVHVFNQESRQFYDLDGLWGDAKPVEWREETQAAAKTR
jgi:ribosome-associated protein